MEKKSKKNWTQWIYWFTFAVAVIAVYKTLDNFTDIMSWIQQLISIIMPFLMGILVAYLFYIPSRKFENLYNTNNKCNITSSIRQCGRVNK